MATAQHTSSSFGPAEAHIVQSAWPRLPRWHAVLIDAAGTLMVPAEPTAQVPHQSSVFSYSQQWHLLAM